MISVNIRRAEAGDEATLATVAERMFRDAYEADNEPLFLDAYVREHFQPSVLAAELADPAVTFFLMEDEGKIIGYSLIHGGQSHPAVASERPVQLTRIYVDREHIGSGIGSRLIERSLEEAAARVHDVVWLGVWERNQRAIAFYERWGFRQVGEMQFDFGGDVQRDLVLARPVRRRAQSDLAED